MNLKNWIKSKPYWLKWGLIFLLIDILIMTPDWIFLLVSSDPAGWIVMFTQLPFIIIGMPIIEMFNYPSKIIVASIFGLIGYFLFGSVMGLIIGKTKSRN